MFNVHWFINGRRWKEFGSMFLAIPQIGDTIRLNDNQFGKVTEILWCLDEPLTDGQRVNIRVEGIDV